MNIKIQIKINSNLLSIDDNPLDIEDIIVENIFLNPFYATEKDILNNIIEKPNKQQIDQVKEIIFNNSILADEQISYDLLHKLGFKNKEIFILKRRFVICASVLDFTKSLYSDYLTSVNKSKSLADMQVSLNIKNDPSIIKTIIDDARECKEDLLDSVNNSTGINFSYFVKGAKNRCSHNYGRTWLSKYLDNSLYASNEMIFNKCDKKFKTGL